MDASPAIAGAVVPLGVAGATAGLIAWYRPDRRALAILADGLGVTVTAATIAAWIARWVAAGHLPLFGTYESALSLGVAVMGVASIARFGGGRSRAAWAAACAVTVAVTYHGLGFDRTAYALTISERSWVVDVHAVLAWLAFGVLAWNAGLGLRVVIRRNDEDADRGLSFSLSLGFVLHSAMLASGSIYKFLLFGTAWSFDPIETLGLLAWLAYGTLLHLHLMAGWSGRRLARWCIGLFVVLTVTYRGIVYFPAWSTYHIFDMDLRIHLTGDESFEEGPP